jgi:glycopeptide antibiotics resistance protein
MASYLNVTDRTYWTLHFYAEKALHLSLFTGVGVALSRAFKSSRSCAFWAIVVGAVVGCSSELFQRLFPTRDPAIRDVLINWAGVLIGVTTGRFWSARLVPNPCDENAAAVSNSLIALDAHVSKTAEVHAEECVELRSELRSRMLAAPRVSHELAS